MKKTNNDLTLMYGDCFELMKNIPDGSIDLIVTDPPFLHVKGGMKSKKYNVGSWKAESYINRNMNNFGKEKIFAFLDEADKKILITV